MNARNQKLLKERYAGHPLRSEIQSALAAAEKFAERHAAIRGNRDLSDEGRAKETKARIREALRDIRDAAEPIAARKLQLKSLMEAIRPISFDKSDLAGALLRREMREALKGMTLAERAALLLGEKADAAFVDAMLEAPALLSGVDAVMSERAREQRLESLFTKESFQAEELTREIEDAEAALTIARDDVQRASGLLDREFRPLVETINAKRNAPWLRKHIIDGEEVVVVVPLKGGPAPRATAEELKEGKFYRNIDEYRADRVA